MLQNKTGIIFGVANKRSIAWAVSVFLVLLADYYNGMKWYAILARVLVGLGAMPLNKRRLLWWSGDKKRLMPVLGGASQYTNMMSYFPRSYLGGRCFKSDLTLPFRFRLLGTGTIRVFGALGRVNKYLAVAILLYDIVNLRSLIAVAGR